MICFSTNQFHIVLNYTGILGGSIRGAIVVDKCIVEESFGTGSAYQSCLNACYKAGCGETCAETSESEVTDSSAERAVTNKRIEMRGGTTLEFINTFNGFNDKTTDFYSWIATLAENPAIVGGNLITIQAALLTAIEQGQHNLNADSDIELTDDEWSAKLTALGQAYNYQNGIYAEEGLYEDGECTLTCPVGIRDPSVCDCQCDSVAACCGFSTDKGSKAGLNYKYIIICFCYIIHVLLS